MTWKKVWANPSAGVGAAMDEDRGFVRLEMDPCPAHESNIVCSYCLPRFMEGAEGLRRLLDPKAAAKITEVSENPAGHKRLALFSPIQRNAYMMRFDGALKVTCVKPIFTGREDRGAYDSITLALYETQAKVCEAHYMKGLSIRLVDGGSEAFIRKLWDARVTVNVDGEYLVTDMKLKDALKKKEILLPKPVRDNCLFSALGVRGENADPGQWLGYMLPKGTQIQVCLEKVPTGGGLLRLETGWLLANYTTKKEDGTFDPEAQQVDIT